MNPLSISHKPQGIREVQLARTSDHPQYRYGKVLPTGAIAVSLPLHAVGAGIAWLAAPIPLLGLVGLVGMVLIMGRRGPLEFLAYSSICILAIAATILPFMYGEQFSKLVVLGRMAVIHSPFPQFEQLLASPGTYNSASGLQLIAGLVLSAGVPWLLTGLFLKPSAAPPPRQDGPLAA